MTSIEQETRARAPLRVAQDPGETVELDILIVGAGPVGLFLANECARRGLRWRLIEARSSQSAHSKALAIFSRTLEILDMAGIVEPFLAEANRVTSVAVMAHARALAHIHFIPEDTPYPFIAMVPQNVTEALLVNELQRKGGSVEYDTKFVSAEQSHDYVDVTLDKMGAIATLKASFVVGCDGAHSAVRHLLNVPLAGGEYVPLFLLADVETNEMPADVLQLCPSEFGPLAIFPIHATRQRIVATIERAEGEAPSLELVQKIVAQRAPSGLEARALHWSSYFRIHHRHAARLRSGRIFIAGDAAHVHSPFGGQGMNTGLHDVWNLAWKLDLSVHGHSNPTLLDSYAAERLPVIKAVIETTDRLTKVMGTPSKVVQALRDTLIPLVSRLAPFRHAFVQSLSELGIRYAGSPIVEGSAKRYFDDSIRGGAGIGSRFLLMIDDTQNSVVKDAAMGLCGSFRELLELRTTKHPGITLVRPDGYIAYSAERGGHLTALETVRSLLERQTEPDGVSASRG